MAWSEEQTETLKRLHGEGLAFSAISKRMDKTRNACIGMARRMGLCKRSTSWSKEAHRTHTSRRVYGKTKRAAPVLRKIKQPDKSANVSLFDRKRNQCSWIEGDTNGAETVCCGLPVQSGSRMQFCPFHLKAGTRRDRSDEHKQADQSRSRKQRSTLLLDRHSDATARAEYYGFGK